MIICLSYIPFVVVLLCITDTIFIKSIILNNTSYFECKFSDNRVKINCSPALEKVTQLCKKRATEPLTGDTSTLVCVL